jgi:hypothetical protein
VLWRIPAGAEPRPFYPSRGTRLPPGPHRARISIMDSNPGLVVRTGNRRSFPIPTRTQTFARFSARFSWDHRVTSRSSGSAACLACSTWQFRLVMPSTRSIVTFVRQPCRRHLDGARRSSLPRSGRSIPACLVGSRGSLQLQGSCLIFSQVACGLVLAHPYCDGHDDCFIVSSVKAGGYQGIKGAPCSA